MQYTAIATQLVCGSACWESFEIAQMDRMIRQIDENRQSDVAWSRIEKMKFPVTSDDILLDIIKVYMKYTGRLKSGLVLMF